MSPSEAPPFTKGDHIMVDIETLSTKSNAAVTSIGACRFTFTNGVKEKFKVNIEPASCREYGLHIDPETVKWWKGQPKEAIKGWTTDPVSLITGLVQFEDWIREVSDKDTTMWCKGLSFDFPILNSAFFAIGKKKPWSHWQEMDLRTVFKMVDYDLTARAENEKDKQYHDALGDAIRQVNQLLYLFEVDPF